MIDVVKSHTLQTIREEFDEYILEDGNTLRIKDILVSFGLGGELKTDESGKIKTKTFVQFNQVTAVIPTADVDTSHLEPIGHNKISDEDRVKEIKFTPKRISLNLYETDEFLIVVRSRLNHVWITHYKDKNEVPIYSLNSDSSMDANVKKSIAPFKIEESK